MAALESTRIQSNPAEEASRGVPADGMQRWNAGWKADGMQR